MELVIINNHPWAVGLRWLPPAKRRFTGHKALLAQAQEMDDAFDVSARCHDKQGVQFGFGAAGESWARYAPVPALCPCLDVPPDFLGLFSLRSTDGKEFWWLHLRIGGAVAEFGDQVFYSEQGARDSLTLMKKIAGLQAETGDSPMASAMFLEDRVRLTPLEKWALGKGHLSNLKKLASHSTVRRVAGLAAILTVIFGVAFCWSYYADRAAREAARQTRQERTQRKADLENHPEKFFPMAWQEKPLATDFAAACLPVMMDLPLSSNGWELQSAVCNGKRVNLEWKHASGANFIRLPDGARLDEKDLRTARSSIALMPVQSRRPDGSGTDHSMLLNREESLGLLAEITQATATKLNPPKFKAQKNRTIDKVKVIAPWHEADWELSGIPDLLMEPGPGPDGMGLFPMLAEIPGLTVESITFNNGWSMKGSIYARH